ncbi:MAG: AmmeMemoRadiSam system radical SAM enzyme [Candidatus Aenigmatarchaeota archaeon]
MTGKETMVYEELDDGKVRCGVCPRRCVVDEGERGFCGVRENQDGKLISLVYGKAVSSNVDPIEKKPLFHFAPGTRALSIATVGCNLRCDFCQNFRISQDWEKISGKDMMPEDVIEEANRYRCQGIAYTYTEPTVFMEYSYDTMVEASPELYNVFVSNGYMTEETVKRIAPRLDAINVDLKGSEDFYREHCGVPDSEPVFSALKKLSEHDLLIEVTNLVIPYINDSEEEIRERVRWIKENLGRDTPVHFSRFRPAYKLTDKPSTPVETLERAVEIGKEEGLYHVYCGNVPGHKSESTYCPKCQNLLIKRHGFSVQEFKLTEGMRCYNCGEEINIGGEPWIPDKLFKD